MAAQDHRHASSRRRATSRGNPSSRRPGRGRSHRTTGPLRYAKRYLRLGLDIPALLPQVYVYLHYAPYTRAHHAPATAPLARQRMDFPLLPQRIRIVIECDGHQHYADPAPGQADPRRHAEMVAEDRELRLRGYEVYRFGGTELTDTPTNHQRLATFFDRLAERYST